MLASPARKVPHTPYSNPPHHTTRIRWAPSHGKSPLQHRFCESLDRVCRIIPPLAPGAQDHERRRLRRLQMMVGTVLTVLRQDADLTPATARAMIANCRNAALTMFPGKEMAFDLIYQPRLERALQERFG